MKPWLDEAQIETWTPFFATGPSRLQLQLPDLFQRHKHLSMTDTPLPRLNAIRRDAQIRAPNGYLRSILDIARYRNGPGLSCGDRFANASLRALAPAGAQHEWSR